MKISNTVPAEFNTNAAYQNILTRVSVRRYDTRPVTDEQISALLHAAMSAPSAVNLQPWEFVVIDDPGILSALAEGLPYAKMAAHAPVAIVACGNKERFLDGIDSVLWEQDLSAATENILLAAHVIGLGGVWTCIYPHEKRIALVHAILNLPDNLIPLGYPLTDHAPMDKWHPERVHLNRFK